MSALKYNKYHVKKLIAELKDEARAAGKPPWELERVVTLPYGVEGCFTFIDDHTEEDDTGLCLDIVMPSSMVNIEGELNTPVEEWELHAICLTIPWLKKENQEWLFQMDNIDETLDKHPELFTMAMECYRLYRTDRYFLRAGDKIINT